MPEIVRVLGGITKQDVDAVVNAAPPSLRCTAGGVDRAIHPKAPDDLRVRA